MASRGSSAASIKMGNDEYILAGGSSAGTTWEAFKGGAFVDGGQFPSNNVHAFKPCGVKLDQNYAAVSGGKAQ